MAMAMARRLASVIGQSNPGKLLSHQDGTFSLYNTSTLCHLAHLARLRKAVQRQRSPY